MSYGLELNFEGYPTIRLDLWYPVINIGTVFGSYYNNSEYRNGVSRNYNIGIIPPPESNMYASGQITKMSYSGPGFLNERYTSISFNGVEKVNISFEYANSASNSDGTWVRTGYAASLTADCTGSSWDTEYGIQIGNKGVDAILGNGAPPLMVLERITKGYSAGTQYVDITIPQLNGKNIEGMQNVAVYVGAKNNAAICDAKFVPVNGSSWSSGAKVRVYLYRNNFGQASRFNKYENLPTSGGTLLVLVGGVKTEKPTGYGIAIFNTKGSATFANNLVPIFAKGVGHHKSLSYVWPPQPGLLGNAEDLPETLLDATVLMPVGIASKPYLVWRKTGSHSHGYYEGSAVKMVKNNKLYDVFPHEYVQSSLSGNSVAGFTMKQNDSNSFTARKDPVVLVRADDYFFI